MSDINKVNEQGRSELHIAAYHQDLDWVSQRGKAYYSHRMSVVEPVFANIEPKRIAMPF